MTGLLATGQIHCVKAIVFPVVIWMSELDHKESSAPKNWCFWTMVLEKIFESPLDYKEIKQVNPKGNQSWRFIRRTDAEAETPLLWTPDAKSWLIWKDPDAGKEWRQEDNRRWDGCMASLTQWTWVWVTSGSGDGQGGLACCSPWGRKVSDMTEWLNRTEMNWIILIIFPWAVPYLIRQQVKTVLPPKHILDPFSVLHLPPSLST